MEDRSHMDCKPDHELEKQTDEMRKKVKAMNVHYDSFVSCWSLHVRKKQSRVSLSSHNHSQVGEL